jgi:apolipoprotein N-acyltransferase
MQLGRVSVRRVSVRELGAQLALRWRACAAVGGGLLGAAAFPRLGIWPLAMVSVALLSLAVDGRRARGAAGLGMLYGLAFFVPLLHWTGIYVGPAPWLILATAEAVFMAGLGALLSRVQRLPGAPAWVACGWVLQEALRDRLPFGGFPWGRLAFSQAASPLRWFAPLGGEPLVTFAVALAGAALWRGGHGVIAALSTGTGTQTRTGTSADRSRARSLIALTAALGVLAAVAVPAVAVLVGVGLKPAPDTAGRTSTVALIQGSVPDRGLAFEDRAGEVLANHIEQTQILAARIAAGAVPRPDLVVWPENASDLDPFSRPDVAQQIDAVVKQIGIPVLVGAILNGPGDNHRRNVGILWSPTTGPGAEYVKRHPVPFAEYIPLRSIAKLVSSDVNLVTQDMVAGKGNGLMTGGPYPIGDVICFEVAYDALVRSSVSAGAQLLVVQTNNATFGHTAETYQQLAMSRLRAVETDRTVLQVATTGASAIIGPDGQIRAQSGALFTPSILEASVPLRTNKTLAVRLGAIPEYVLAALALLVLFGDVIAQRGRRTKPRRAAASAVEPMPVAHLSETPLHDAPLHDAPLHDAPLHDAPLQTSQTDEEMVIT